MALIKLIPVLLTLGFSWNPIMCRELTAQRMKRSLTTICVEIKPSGPQEEPYYMCKGTDLPPLVPKDNGANYKTNNPSYSGSNFQNPHSAYNAQYQESNAETYEKQPTNTKQNNGPGYEGFRRPATQSAASYQPATSSPVQQPNVPKQQFFPKLPEFQSQQKFEQQEQQFKSSPPTQPAAGYGFSTGKQQSASYTPSNAPYVSESGATQAQSTYSESGGNPSGGGGTYVRPPQSSAASYGSSTKQHSPNVASGSFAKSSFSTSLPVASAAQAPFGQTLPYANAAAASPDVEEHDYAKETPPSAFMVPATQKPPATNIKTKNSAASQYDADEQPNNDQHSYAANIDNGRAAALYQSSPVKAASPKLKDYRSMLSEDIFQSPIWGFSPDEFASFRSISDEVEQPFYTPNVARSQEADSFLRNMPPQYRDDPVMRQFYKSLHEPLVAPDPLLAMPINTRFAHNSKTAKVPMSIAARPQVSAPIQPAPQPQRASPQVKQPAAINSGALCETTTPPPPPPRQQSKQCSQDSIAASPYAPPTRLMPPPNCEPCNRRDYNFQPVFIALPCYGQQTGFGNLNPSAAAYLNLGVPSPQSSYPSPMNQYAPSSPGEAALFSGFGPGANFYPTRQGASPAFGMPYTTSNLGSPNPFGFYNNPQYPAAYRASSPEENAGRQTSNISKPAVRKPATSNERGSNLVSQESVEFDAAKSTETTNNEFTMNTSMETAETKATQPAGTTSVTEATPKTTVAEIQKKPATNARTSGSSKEQLLGADTDAKDAKNAAVNKQGPTTEAVPMEEETHRTYESMMSLAQQFSKLNQDEFIDFDFDDDDKTQVMSNEEQRKGKRHNARQQGAYKRQNVPTI